MTYIKKYRPLLSYMASRSSDWLFANSDSIIFLNNRRVVPSFGRAANKRAYSTTPKQLVTTFRKALWQQPWNSPFLWSLSPRALATSSHRVSGWWKICKIPSHSKLQTEYLSERLVCWLVIVLGRTTFLTIWARDLLSVHEFSRFGF